MTNGIAEALYNVRQIGAEMRVATVIAVSSTTMTILVAGTVFDVAYVDLGPQTPIVGDLVVAFRQDSTWTVIGRKAGVGPNMVQNFSFEDDGDTATTPSHWFLYNISGTGMARATNTGYAPAGLFELAVNAGGSTQDTYVYSEPIPVEPGQSWAASAFASGIYATPGPAAATADVDLYALWFANPTDLYPTTAAADSLIASALNVGPAPLHASVSGTVTVPGGVSFMRIATRSKSLLDITVLWDAVIARKIG